MAAWNPASDASDEAGLISGLRGGDEAAFVTLVERYQGALVRLAMTYVPSSAVAEEVVQETWLAVLQGIDRFEARSSLKTWIFTILANRAKRRGEREQRTLPFSALAAADDESPEPAVDPSRFRPAGEPWAGGWVAFPQPWQCSPEEGALSAEIRSAVEAAIAALPPAQRQVITLRDVEGWSAADVCNLLALSETNQRVLLHRARSRVRRVLEQELEGV